MVEHAVNTATTVSHLRDVSRIADAAEQLPLPTPIRRGGLPPGTLPKNIERFKNSRKGTPLTPEQRDTVSEAKGGVRAATYLYLVRGGNIIEVAHITGFSSSQVGHVVDKLRVNGEVGTPTPEETSVRKTIGLKFRYALERNGGLTDHQEHQFELVRKLVEFGLVPTDLSHRESLLWLYKKEGRQLPESIADQMRLEVFFISQVRSQEDTDSYQAIGDEIDQYWFRTSMVGEEQFILNNLNILASNAKAHIFARRLINLGHASIEPRVFDGLEKVYKLFGRQLPDDSTVQLILDVFCKARQQANYGDRAMLEQYIVAGEAVGPDWFDSDMFNDEQKFISDALSRVAALSSNGSKPKRVAVPLAREDLSRENMAISARRLG